jgi:hypothetical protein
MILVAIEIKDDLAAAAVGLSERSVWSLMKAMVGGNINGLLKVRGGSGRPRKAKDFKGAIIEEVEKNNTIPASRSPI